MELPELDLTSGDDFIPIEDLPSEKIELPTELLGKFEATKMEAAPQTAPAEKPEKDNKPNNNKYQQRQQRYNNNNRNNNQNNGRQQQAQNNNHIVPQGTTANLPAPQPVVAEPVQPKPVENRTNSMIFWQVQEFWKLCPTVTVSFAHLIIIIFPHQTIFMFLSRKLNYSD